MYVLAGIIGTLWMLALFATAIDFTACLFSGELRPVGIFVGLALFAWLIAWSDSRP